MSESKDLETRNARKWPREAICGVLEATRADTKGWCLGASWANWRAVTGLIWRNSKLRR